MDVFFADVQTKAEANEHWASWAEELKECTVLLYRCAWRGEWARCFSDWKESATWNEVWNWYAQGNLKGGLGLGASDPATQLPDFPISWREEGLLLFPMSRGEKRTYLSCLVFYRAGNCEIRSMRVCGPLVDSYSIAAQTN